MFFINHKDIEDKRAAIVEIEGPLNSDTSPDFGEYIKKLIENGIIYFLIDFRKISFISSEGIGAALMLHKRITAENGAAVFCNLNSEVTTLFRILGFNRIFNIAENVSDALDLIELKMGRGTGEYTAPVTDFETETEINRSRDIPLPEPELLDFDEPVIFNDEFEIRDEETLDPFVIECLKCGSLVRVKEHGDHICPFCKADFTVTEDGRALFRIDES